MHDWIKQNQKKVLAVLGALLMVTFLIQTGNRGATGPRREHGREVGRAGKFILYADVLRQYQLEWQTLAQIPRLDLSRAAGRYVRAVSVLGATLSQQITEHPELFPLLVNEAQERGIAFNDDVVMAMIQNQIGTRFLNPTEPTSVSAVRHLLMLQALRDELTSDAKYPEPMWTHDLASGQRISLNVVEYSADPLKLLVAPPTTQQVQDLFEQFRHVEADSPVKPPEDTLGFGYETPNRVKVQYLTVPRDAVRDAVKAAHADAKEPGQLDYDLRVKAREYYYRHQSDFPTPPATAPATAPSTLATTLPATQPTTAPTTLAATLPATDPASIALATTQPTTAPATTPATIPAIAATQPTTRPFADVQAEIIDKLLEPEIDKLQNDIAEAIRVELTADWRAYQKTVPATQPTTLPSSNPSTNPADAVVETPTTLPAGADTYAKLETIALDIQKRFHVLPQVTQLAEWQDAKALEKLTGIGSARPSGAEAAAFADLAIQNAAPFVTDPAAKGAAIQLFQPSPVLQDSAKNAYLFRLTEASPAHAPSLADVQARVEADARVKAAYDAANNNAKKLIEAAKRDGLSRAALDDHRQVISTGLFLPHDVAGGRERDIPNFKASPETAAALAAKAQELLAAASPAEAHPIALLQLPEERRVLVLELADVTLPIAESRLYQEKLATAEPMARQMSEFLANSYFSADAVFARVKYVPVKENAKE